jgi:predicted O-methyltransferase YrrM
MDECRADEVLRRIEASAYRSYLPIVGRRRGRILSETIRKHNPRRILEVGTLVGYSAILMGKELGEGSEIIGIEFDEDEAEQARINISDAMLKPSVKVLVGDALEILPRLEGSFDMMFLDAAKHQYLEYLHLVEDKLHRGSVVVADNAGWMSHSMRGYLDYVRSSGRYRSKLIRIDGDGVELSIKL